VALSSGDRILAAEDLGKGSASAQVVSAVRRLLEGAGLRLSELDAIGVVHGPGSFTGMRAGLAVAKGFCEATRLPLIAASRLQVLIAAASTEVFFAALDAGRGDLYVREAMSGQERLCSLEAFRELASGKAVAFAEAHLADQLAEACLPVLRPLHAADALAVVSLALDAVKRDRSTAESQVLADANYIRLESDMYGRPSQAAARPARTDG
jgi:tRNA threonylcarbamoyladenosine biosynthesis protein TsaB